MAIGATMVGTITFSKEEGDHVEKGEEVLQCNLCLLSKNIVNIGVPCSAFFDDFKNPVQNLLEYLQYPLLKQHWAVVSTSEHVSVGGLHQRSIALLPDVPADICLFAEPYTICVADGLLLLRRQHGHRCFPKGCPSNALCLLMSCNPFICSERLMEYNSGFRHTWEPQQ